MKKIIFGIIMVMLFVACAGCGKKESELLTKSADGNLVVLDAKIVSEICGADGEKIISSSQAPAEKVFADLILYVNNTGTSAIDGDTLSGKVQYDGDEYNTVFGLENDLATGVSGSALEAGKAGVVHIFACIPNSALDTKDQILAWVEVDGSYYGKAVSPMNYSEPINQKQEVKVGDKKDILGGNISFEVLSCDISNTIYPSNDPTRASVTDSSSPTLNVALKITNNTPNDITDVYSYVVNNEGQERASVRKESSDGTSFETISEQSPIKSGETRVVHIYASYAKSADSKMRFNLMGNAFFIKA